MKHSTYLTCILVAAAATSLFTTGCVVRERVYAPGPPPPPPGAVVDVGGEVDVSGPPPVPLVEVQPVAPDPTFV